ncbi:MAG: globin family protein [Thiotrichales bacterium]
MTPEQKQLVKDSWEKVVPISETAADLFYNRLFEIAPETQSYFKGDMKEQGAKLMTMINVAVNGLDNIEALVEPLKDLGKRHVDYGVTQKDYDSVGAALLWTLEQGLGDAFTDDVKEAWTVTYGTVASVAIDGAGYDS